ncbi:MAG: hypothetical protein HQK83_16020 [Fibrobacteria bacterium]|nr:hypothetical protein [Fibrobacteria bacterium]
MLRSIDIDPQVKCTSFSTNDGTREVFISISTRECSDLETELENLSDLYQETLNDLGLSENTLAFSRLFVSDIENQKSTLEQSSLYMSLKRGAFSIVQQPPIEGGHVSLFSYHIKPDTGSFTKELIDIDAPKGRNSLAITGKHYKMLWTANYSGHGPFDAAKQTDEVMSALVSTIQSHDMTLLDNMIRTWVYVRDIDNHYAGMVKSRRDLFQEHGLTDKTRYLASTGIEGKFHQPGSLVSVDSLSFGGLHKGQIVRMKAPEHLSPTIKYGVTFERGLKIIFGDRTRYVISGTASINSNGELLYPNDVKKQTERTLDNIQALLTPHGANFKDMAYFIVYLRDPKDSTQVQEILQKHIPQNIPCIFLHAPVCRPGWLVEIEGLGIKSAKSDFEDFL